MYSSSSVSIFFDFLCFFFFFFFFDFVGDADADDGDVDADGDAAVDSVSFSFLLIPDGPGCGERGLESNRKRFNCSSGGRAETLCPCELGSIPGTDLGWFFRIRIGVNLFSLGVRVFLKND